MHRRQKTQRAVFKDRLKIEVFSANPGRTIEQKWSSDSSIDFSLTRGVYNFIIS